MTKLNKIQMQNQQIQEFKAVANKFKESKKFNELLELARNDKPKRNDLSLSICVDTYNRNAAGNLIARIGWIWASDEMKKKGFSASFTQPNNQIDSYHQLI